MKIIYTFMVVIALTGCDSGGSSDGKSSGGGGLIGSMANGFAAGAGAAAGHQAIQHGIEKFKNFRAKKAATNFRPREKVINPRSRFAGRRR
jgi:hypothetical protein